MLTITLPKAPEWLTKRGGSLTPGIREHMLYLMIDADPLYKLEVRPANGTFICAIQQAINGKRLDDGTAYPTPESALTGGLEQLRAKLGW